MSRYEAPPPGADAGAGVEQEGRSDVVDVTVVARCDGGLRVHEALHVAAVQPTLEDEQHAAAVLGLGLADRHGDLRAGHVVAPQAGGPDVQLQIGRAALEGGADEAEQGHGRRDGHVDRAGRAGRGRGRRAHLVFS